MKTLLFAIFLYTLLSFTKSEDNCVDQTDACLQITEYNSYIACLDENRRHKRSTGCSSRNENCEFIDCQNCQEVCTPNCVDCECPSSCRQCCSQTCSTNLCCHKTCHNQCKTNYCRTECKKDCKQRIYDSDTDIKVDVNDDRNITSNSKHNITTIINLHNIINNTNLIDIPIKINNTNYNNITLRRSSDGRIISEGSIIKEEDSYDTSFEQTGNKCCFVISPRQCVKTNYYPFTKCYHYRHRRCGPFCVANIVHAQLQNYCDDLGCNQKTFYIPQIQPRCFHQSYWPFVNCGGHNTFHNCHGCYDHQSVRNGHHHMRCSRCYDDGTSPYYRPGPFFQFGYAPGYFGSFGNNPMFPYPMQMPPMGNPNFGYPQIPAFSNPGMNYYGELDSNLANIDEEIIDTKSKNEDNNLNTNIGSVGTYIHDVVVPPDFLKSDSSNLEEQNSKSNTTKDNPTFTSSKYALISIDPLKTSNNNKREDKKEKKLKKRKDEEEKLTTIDILTTTEKKSTITPQI